MQAVAAAGMAVALTISELDVVQVEVPVILILQKLQMDL